MLRMHTWHFGHSRKEKIFVLGEGKYYLRRMNKSYFSTWILKSFLELEQSIYKWTMAIEVFFKYTMNIKT